MRHQLSGRKLNRTTPHRKALLSNLTMSLVKYEQIQTTLPKAKELRSYAERLVTLARRGDLHAYRQILSKVGDKETTQKLVDVLAKRYEKRPGGYTRILKNGFRHGDNAPMAVIEFVDRDLTAKPAKKVKEEAEEATAE